MTAPANDALLITLLALFTACAGYAAGRLHQWYRTGLDRDEAYRDGYDTATRSVFSLAARLISPRRGVRGTAAVSANPGEGSRSGILGRRAASAAGGSPSPVKAASSSGSVSSLTSPSSTSSSFSSAAGSISSLTSPSSAAGGGSAKDKAEGGRHFAPDELVQGPTYRLTPDRVARAKVREITPADDNEQETTRLSSVPRPRAS